MMAGDVGECLGRRGFRREGGAVPFGAVAAVVRVLACEVVKPTEHIRSLPFLFPPFRSTATVKTDVERGGGEGSRRIFRLPLLGF